MKLKPYPTYKDTGVEWLGNIPANWASWKISHAFGSIGSGTTPPSDEQLWYENGNIPWITTGELRENTIFETSKYVTSAAFDKFSALRLHPSGSLAIAMYGATIGRLGILGVDATTNQACCVLSSPKQLDIKFIFYWLLCLKQPIIDLYATGGGQPNINQETIASLRVPAPLIKDQASIANFLDRETAKLDTLIAKQEELIELLQEKRQAIISHVVTKGLNPDAKMKDSGVEWLGEVPEGWHVVKIKWLFEIKKRIAGVLGYDVLSITQTGVKVKDIESGDGQLSMDYSKYQLVEVGDFAMNHMDLLTGYVDVSGYKGVTSPDYRVFTVRDPDRISKRYFLYLFQMGYKNKLFYPYGQGSSQLGRWRLPTEQFNEFVFPHPAIDEQELIADYLDQETRKNDNLVDKAKRSIELAKEHCTALIFAAVTGKIDVREAA